MVRLLMRLDLGSDMSLGALSSIVQDVSVVLDLGLRVDAVAARSDARREIERLWTDRSDELYDQSQRLDAPSSEELRRLLEQRREADRFRERLAVIPPDFWWEEWYGAGRYSSRKERPGFVSPPAFWASLGATEAQLSELAPNLFAQLVAEEAGRRLPSVPVVESLTYQSPLEVVLIVAGTIATGAGFKFGTFTELAKLIRDWSADKRQSEVRVNQAEARVEREHAQAEKTRAETREILAQASKTELETELLRRFASQTNRLDDLVEAGVMPRELQAVAQLTSADVEVELTEDES